MRLVRREARKMARGAAARWRLAAGRVGVVKKIK
jgi:hypothetical protein